MTKTVDAFAGIPPEFLPPGPPPSCPFVDDLLKQCVPGKPTEENVGRFEDRLRGLLEDMMREGTILHPPPVMIAVTHHDTVSVAVGAGPVNRLWEAYKCYRTEYRSIRLLG